MVWAGSTPRSAGGENIDFWPDTLDNLTWSKDNIIAVGGGEHTSLLIPKLKLSRSDDKHWDRISIKTSFFTQDEFPSQLPLSWSNFSIGEEMSEAFVHSLDWSPPGLGKHKRCVLAVLTSNHMLSLWECIGKPEIATDWVRACVVNHVIEAHFKSQHYSDPESEQEKFERIKSHQRIRAFAWSQAPQPSSLNGASGAYTTKFPYLAVSNDRGDVFVIKVQSPYDLLSPHIRQWSLSIMQSFKVEVPRAKKSPLVSCMPIGFQWRATFVDQLAWSPWSTDSSGALTSILAFTSQSSLQCRLMRLVNEDDHTTMDAGYTISLLSGERNIHPAGAIRWAPKLKDAKDAFLIYPTHKVLYCLQVSPGFGTGFQVTMRELNNAWDEVAGLSFTQDDNETFSLHLAYRLSSGTDRVVEFLLPFTAESASSSSSWQDVLLEEQNKFSNENGLGDNASTRTYGICISPPGDVLAVNISHHPSDAVEYTINSDQVSSIIMNRVKEGEENESLPFANCPSHSYEITAEAILFSLQSFVTHQSPADVNTDSLLSQILHTVDLTDAPTIQHNQGLITEDTSTESIVRQVRQNILFHRDSIASRSRQLLSLINGNIPKTPPLDAIIVRRIVTEVARLPHFIADSSSLSLRIMQLHCSILAKLDARAGGEEADTSAAEDEDLEKCDMCNSNISFESLRWARCANKHQYPRCTLSFLAIQTPGTAKACHICNAQYLNEFLMPELTHAENYGANLESGTDGGQMMQGGSGQEPQISLARILFAACDRCVCCGGKFVG